MPRNNELGNNGDKTYKTSEQKAIYAEGLEFFLKQLTEWRQNFPTLNIETFIAQYQGALKEAEAIQNILDAVDSKKQKT